MEEKVCGIYCIENKLTGRKYVGQSVDIKRRYGDHKNKKSTLDIHKDIKEYGSENFSMTVLERCDKELLDITENKWIKELNTITPNGYNKRFVKIRIRNSVEFHESNVGKNIKLDGILIPPKIYLDKRLSACEKILYGFIAALSENNICMVTNSKLGHIVGITKNSASRSISRLNKFGFVNIKEYDIYGNTGRIIEIV